MASPYSLAMPARHSAAGIDLNRRAVRVVVVRRLWPWSAVMVEAVETVPLDLAGVQSMDEAAWAAVTRALGQALGRAIGGGARAAIPGVMALADRALTWGSCAVGGTKGGREAPEAAVRAAVERASGLAGEPLALDWRVVAGGNGVEFVAASRSEIDARIEAAATCGVELRAIDGEPPAALRALRYVAAAAADVLGTDGGTGFHALWVGDAGFYGWYVERGRVVARIRFPSPEYERPADALRALANQGAARRGWLCGEFERLGPAGLSPGAISDLLGCQLEIFTLAMLDHAKGLTAAESAPEYAVAFGLALRGVLE